MDLREWLRGLGLERYEAAFRENEIDEKVLPSLTAEDLKELGVKPSVIAASCSMRSPLCGLKKRRMCRRFRPHRHTASLRRTRPSAARSP
jgi:hypothetical protein